MANRQIRIALIDEPRYDSYPWDLSCCACDGDVGFDATDLHDGQAAVCSDCGLVDRFICDEETASLAGTLDETGFYDYTIEVSREVFNSGGKAAWEKIAAALGDELVVEDGGGE